MKDGANSVQVVQHSKIGQASQDEATPHQQWRIIVVLSKAISQRAISFSFLGFTNDYATVAPPCRDTMLTDKKHGEVRDIPSHDAKTRHVIRA
jgi:hypothetical protein